MWPTKINTQQGSETHEKMVNTTLHTKAKTRKTKLHT